MKRELLKQQQPATSALPDLSTRVKAIEALLESEKRNLEYQEQLQIAAPKVESHDAFLSTKGTDNLTQTFKTLDMKPNKAIDFLEYEKNWLYRADGDLVPVQQLIDRGHFTVIKVPRGNSGKCGKQARITPKGLDMLRKKRDEGFFDGYDVPKKREKVAA